MGNSDMTGGKDIPVADAVGAVLAHDITEIRPGEFKGRAFKKGHIIRQEDLCHLQRLGKERLFILKIAPDEMHEDEAAHILAAALIGEGVSIESGPMEGKINLMAVRDGLLQVNKEALLAFNMIGDVMCSALHDNTLVKKGQVVARTRAIPLVIKRKTVLDAVSAVSEAAAVEVKKLRKPRAGVVVTGNEVYYGKIKDAFAPVIRKKIEEFGGKIIGIHYVPDDKAVIRSRLEQLLAEGADLLITTGGMPVAQDDVTRFAIRELGGVCAIYGSPALLGAMFLIIYLARSRNGTPQEIPVLGIPACGMYHGVTVFDIVLPRVLAGEKIGRRELAELGHGGLCQHCKECGYPDCPFGK